jgi:acylglycerol lipase
MSYELSAEERQRTVSWNELEDGSRRAFYSWPRASSNASVASVLIVPGLGEHGGRYAASATTLAQSEFEVYAIDLIGHGLNPGRRGCIESYDGLMNEIEVAIKAVESKNPQLPVVLWGHSMGGNLVLNYLLRKSRLPKCAIASGPMLRATRLPSRAFLWLARRLALLLPNYQLKTPVHYSDCTRDEAQQALMKNDQLFHKQLSLRLGAALIDSGQWALDHAERLHTPVLLVHSAQDQITSAVASTEFAQSSPKYCELKLLNEQLHDVHRDIGSEAVLAFMCDWLRKRVVAG